MKFSWLGMILASAIVTFSAVVVSLILIMRKSSRSLKIWTKRAQIEVPEEIQLSGPTYEKSK